jgi:hypothetical protein
MTRRRALWSAGVRAAAALVVLAALSWAPAAGGAAQREQRPRACDRFASVGGDDDARGTRARPFRTIGRLLAALGPGRAGCLLGGTFVEDVSIKRGGRRTARLTLRSAPGTRALIQGYVVIRDSANHVTLSRVDVDGHDGRPITIHVYGDDALLDDLDVTNRNKVNRTYTGSCILLGRAGLPTFRPIVQRSRIHNCGSSGHDHGIYAEFPRNAVIRDNYIYDSPGYGISLYPDAQRTLIARNVIDANGHGNITFSGEKAGKEYDQDYASSRNRVVQNVIANARSRYNVESFFPSLQPVGNILSRNCVWNAPWGNFGYTSGYARSGNLEVDPRYVNRERKDFRLARGSLCRSAGPSQRSLSQSQALRRAVDPSRHLSIQASPSPPQPSS